MLEYRTEGFNGYAVKYSPFFDSRVAVAASSNFGLSGNGRLYVLDLTPDGIIPLTWFTTPDSLFDLSWSETQENQVLAASGDGSIKLFDASIPDVPVTDWKEHTREVFGVHWNLVSKDRFCSSSWDGSVKIWSPERPQSLLTLATNSCTYSVQWSPHSPDVLSCVASDSMLRVFDLRTRIVNNCVLELPIHQPGVSQPAQSQSQSPAASTAPAEALTHDWNKYRSSTVATGSVDRLIRTFDIRSPLQGAASVMAGHKYAVRRLSWSPHVSNVLLSASYDMTCRIWNDGTPATTAADAADGSAGTVTREAPSLGREVGTMPRHTEFATGVDWCMFGAEGWAASCGWDERLCIWDARAFMT